MRRDPLERLSIRAALVLGFGSLVGLWVLTGWAFSERLADLEAQTAAVTARFIKAQDVLATVRTQLNYSSLVLRDALLETSSNPDVSYEQRLENIYQSTLEALDSYEPVLASSSASTHVARLQAEVQVFSDMTLRVLQEDTAGAPRIRLLEEQLAPRRATTIALSDEIRDLNRQALLQHQTAVAALHRAIEQQWWLRLGLTLLISLAIALIAVVYAGRLEDRLRRQRLRDQQSARELQQLSARLVAAQEEERRIIARELHDEVGQVLSAIKVDLTRAQRAFEQLGVSTAELEEPQQLADSALRTVRDLSQLLRPAVLDDLGLAAAVDWLLRGMARRNELQTSLVQDSPIPRLAPETEVAAFRIIQEALTNVARHAGARRCIVRLASHEHWLTIRVEDDGQGFDDEAACSQHGMGLIGMRERVSERGGTFDITSVPGLGTRLFVRLPGLTTPETTSTEVDETVPFGNLSPPGQETRIRHA